MPRPPDTERGPVPRPPLNPSTPLDPTARRVGPCDRFTLDYYTDPTRAHHPEHRYCVCGWTEAHHKVATA